MVYKKNVLLCLYNPKVKDHLFQFQVLQPLPSNLTCSSSPFPRTSLPLDILDEPTTPNDHALVLSLFHSYGHKDLVPQAPGLKMDDKLE